jgi:hypothetical protein
MRPIISNPFEGATEVLHDNALPELLVNELQHRLRNLLSVVQCFVVKPEAKTADDYREALTARIASLSDAHDLIESARSSRLTGGVARTNAEATFRASERTHSPRWTRHPPRWTRHHPGAAPCFITSLDFSRTRDQRQQAQRPNLTVRSC